MKRFDRSCLALLICYTVFQSHASVVYEGFDYTSGTALVGQGTGDGWSGNWASGGGSNLAEVDDGLSLGSVPGIGGAAQRPDRSGNAAISRTISGASQTALTADGSTIWFSVLMKTFAGSTGNGSTDGFALNSWGTIVLGDTALTGGSGTAPAPIGTGGNAIGVGFAGTGGGGDFADIRVQGVTYAGGTVTQNSAERITVGDAAVMIVGKVDWAADGSDDTVTLYNVTDPEATLPAAFSTMTADLDQSSFNVVSIGDAQTSVFDEIRFDTEFTNVLAISSGGTTTNEPGGTTVTNTVTPPELQLAAARTSLNVAATFPGTNTFPFLLQFASNLTDNAWSNVDSAFTSNTSWDMPVSPSTGFYRARKQPNIVFVFADQMRACALGTMGNTEVITPELDQLATEGIVLTDAFSAQPVCTPYRGHLLSGRYGHTTGVYHNDIRMPDDELLLPTIMKSNGYATGYIGKWHLSGDRGNPVDAISRRDWDYWAVRNVSHDHDNVVYWVNDDTSPTTVPGAWEPTVQTDLAIDFINQHTNEPFCLMVSIGAPHNPYEAPAEYVAMYDDVTITPRPNVPASRFNYTTMLNYYAMITSVSENMGRLSQAIEEAGLADDTIFVFTSDHGDMLGSLGQTLKQRPWEESINIPFIIRYPGGIEAGQRRDWLFSSVDVMPTLLGLCQIDAPDNLQGMDYSSTFTGASSAERDAVFLFNVHAGAGPNTDWRGIRTKDWVYAYHYDGDWVMYDLVNDPYQLNNLIDNPAYAAQKATLKGQLDAMRAELGDSMELVGSNPPAIILP